VREYAVLSSLVRSDFEVPETGGWKFSGGPAPRAALERSMPLSDRLFGTEGDASPKERGAFCTETMSYNVSIERLGGSKAVT
jgi:hypothetical protein